MDARSLSLGCADVSKSDEGRAQSRMTAPSDGDRVSLGPSGWNYWRPFYVGQTWLAAGLALPVIVLSIFLQSMWLMLAGVVFSGVAQLLSIRGQRDAFFTRTRIHRRRG